MVSNLFVLKPRDEVDGWKAPRDCAEATAPAAERSSCCIRGETPPAAASDLLARAAKRLNMLASCLGAADWFFCRLEDGNRAVRIPASRDRDGQSEVACHAEPWRGVTAV